MKITTNQDNLIQLEEELKWSTLQCIKVEGEKYKIERKYNQIVNEMRELCMERSNASKVESIINRLVKTFNNPNP